MVSSVTDLLLRTLFNIDAATEVTLSVESYTLLFLQCCSIFRCSYSCVAHSWLSQGIMTILVSYHKAMSTVAILVRNTKITNPFCSATKLMIVSSTPTLYKLQYNT